VRRRSIKLRLLAGGFLVATCAIATTAWLSVQGTTGAIQHEQGEVSASAALSYDTLVGYAATHRDWTGVGPVLGRLHRTTGLTVALTTTGRKPIASSGTPGDSSRPGKLAAVVDPLAVDVSLQPGAAPDRIDARAVGPFRLPAADRAPLRRRAAADVACTKASGRDAEIRQGPSGRPYVALRDGGSAPRACNRLGDQATDGRAADAFVRRLTPTESGALLGLNRRLIGCLDREHTEQSKADLTAGGALVPTAPPRSPSVYARCMSSSRRAQLAPYVASPALLLIGTGAAPAPAAVGLPSAGLTRIVIAALIVLTLTLAVGSFLASRVLRPLRVLTDAATRMRSGDRTARADVRARWEVAELAHAFNDMAEHVARTEQQRTELVSDVSHDLRTPVGTLRGWLIATQDGLADLSPELVASLLEETDVLQHLVDDLHDLALADAGELRMVVEGVDAAEIVRQLAAAHPGVVVVDVAGDLRLPADRLRLRQALNNLVTNAIRHSPPDGRVTLRGRREHDRVVLEVIDTGGGIAPDDLAHVFDRFWRADKSRSRTTGGSGLGLAIVKHVVDAHQGTITVRSVVGAGTTFSMSLPGRDGARCL
jgi:two-component system sensor histidine kinase BaeS